MLKYSVGKNLKEIESVFSRNGFSVYLVGGAVRDWILKKPCKDFDIATDASPMQVQKLFRKKSYLCGQKKKFHHGATKLAPRRKIFFTVVTPIFHHGENLKLCVARQKDE